MAQSVLARQLGEIERRGNRLGRSVVAFAELLVTSRLGVTLPAPGEARHRLRGDRYIAHCLVLDVMRSAVSLTYDELGAVMAIDDRQIRTALRKAHDWREDNPTFDDWLNAVERLVAERIAEPGDSGPGDSGKAAC